MKLVELLINETSDPIIKVIIIRGINNDYKDHIFTPRLQNFKFRFVEDQFTIELDNEDMRDLTIGLKIFTIHLKSMIRLRI